MKHRGMILGEAVLCVRVMVLDLLLVQTWDLSRHDAVLLLSLLVSKGGFNWGTGGISAVTLGLLLLLFSLGPCSTHDHGHGLLAALDVAEARQLGELLGVLAAVEHGRRRIDDEVVNVIVIDLRSIVNRRIRDVAVHLVSAAAGTLGLAAVRLFLRLALARVLGLAWRCRLILEDDFASVDI